MEHAITSQVFSSLFTIRWVLSPYLKLKGLFPASPKKVSFPRQISSNHNIVVLCKTRRSSLSLWSAWHPNVLRLAVLRSTYGSLRTKERNLKWAELKYRCWYLLTVHWRLPWQDDYDELEPRIRIFKVSEHRLHAVGTLGIFTKARLALDWHPRVLGDLAQLVRKTPDKIKIDKACKGAILAFTPIHAI